MFTHLARLRDEFLSPTPPKALSARALAAAAFLTLAYLSGFGYGRPVSSSTIRFLVQQDAGGAWVAPPVPGPAPAINLELTVYDRTGLGWSVRDVGRSLGINSLVPAPNEWARAFSVWKAALDANDLSTTHITGDPRPIADLQALAADLLARETASPTPPAGLPGHVQFCDHPAVHTLCNSLWIFPALALVGVPFLAVYRASRPAHWRGELTMLGHGLCPKCRYSRQGLEASALCPECGCDPEQLKANYQRYLDQQASRRPGPVAQVSDLGEPPSSERRA